MKKLFNLLSGVYAFGDTVIPLGGQAVDPTFNNCATFRLKEADLEGDDVLVLFVLNTVPEQGAVAQQGGWNYIIQTLDDTDIILTTSMKNHPYKTESDGVTPLKINADVVDLETCYNAYKNALYHTVTP